MRNLVVKRTFERLEAKQLLTSFSSQLLADFSSGQASSDFSFHPAKDLLYLNVNDGEQFWRTDGTTAGTIKLPDANIRGEGIEALGLTLFNVETDSGSAIWRTDGSVEGTFELMQGEVVKAFDAFDVSFLTVKRDSTTEVWRTNGGPDAPEQIMVHPDDTFASTSFQLSGETVYVFGGGLLYACERGSSQPVLLHSDATDAPVAIDQGDFFVGRDGDQRQLYKTDGTVAGTTAIVETGGYRLIGLDDRLVFFDGEEFDYGIWGSDGTAQGTVKLADASIFSSVEAVLNGSVIYSESRSLSRSDGTIEGTHRHEVEFSEQFYSPGVVNGRAYFSTGDLFSLVSTDGSSFVDEASGEDEISGLSRGIAYFRDDELFVEAVPPFGPAFVAVVGEGRVTGLLDGERSIQVARGGGVWYSSGRDFFEGEDSFYRGNDVIEFESSNLTFLTDGNTAIDENTRVFKTADQPLFFLAGPEENQTLWAIDGGIAPTAIGDLDEQWHYSGDGFFFVRTTDATGQEVWGSDGTEEGTQVIEIRPGAESSDPQLLKWNDTTLVVAETTESGRELWVVATDADEPLLADLNGDRTVDFADFLILSDNFGKTEAVRDDGDLDGDGVVAFTDFLLLANEFQP